ncbi:MAG: type II/IV secretion system ATPase subunit [Nitrososphaeria archaeon]|nr:type II/IV secretion system ATPase subunit [Nitrososphaeria archaeon]
MNTGGILSNIFSRDPEERFREKLFLQATGNRVRLLDFSAVNGRLVDSYTLELGEMYKPKVYIFDCNGFGYYFVREPSFDERDRESFEIVLGYLLSSANLNGEGFGCKDFLEEKILRIVKDAKLDVSLDKVKLFSEIVFRETSGYGLLEPLMADDNVSDISCSAFTQPVLVRHREFSEYNWMATNVVFSEEELDTLVQKMASKHGKGINILSPASEITTREGHRIMLTFKNEITLPSSTFSIRKFPKNPWTIAKLIAYRTLNEDLAAYLWQVLENRHFIIISGAMGSGKTTLLSTLLQLIDLRHKILTIEDTAEIALGDRVNWQRLITRKSAYSGTNDISLLDLTLLSLRSSSDYIALGEVRGAEIQALVQAAGTGLGCITTFHAGGFQELLSRMKGKPLSVEDSFLQTIKCVVFLSNVKASNGKILRKVTSVEEPYFREGEGFKSNIVYDYEAEGDEVEVDKIVSRSRLFDKVKDTLKEACRKRDFLRNVASLKAYTFEQLQPLLSRFYGDSFGC